MVNYLALLALALSELDEPTWFSTRTDAPTCGLVSGETSAPEPWSDHPSIDCFSTAVENNERAELVTVHTGNDRRVARWIVSLGPGPSGIERFEVASVVVDEGAVTNRWFETRCVEGEFVGGRLVGDFIVDRDLVDELDPSGTIVTDNGDVLELPDPDERSQLQPCNGPAIVDRPVVTPFEATGLRIGDESAPATRPDQSNVMSSMRPPQVVTTSRFQSRSGVIVVVLAERSTTVTTQPDPRNEATTRPASAPTTIGASAEMTSPPN